MVDAEWEDFSYGFTTRGCPNHCAYCVVKNVEPDRWLNPEWRKQVFVPGKKNAMIFDNNVSAIPRDHLRDVLAELARAGMGVNFDNGFDVKHVDEELVGILAGTKFVKSGMRVAFDRIGEDGEFQRAVRLILSAGIPKSAILSFVLFNFNDTPKEADYRARECVKLGVHPYPQQFVPATAKRRNPPFIGKHWTKRLLKAFRFFWLMAGSYTKYEFADWAAKQGPGSQYALDPEDWAAWNQPWEKKAVTS